MMSIFKQLVGNRVKYRKRKLVEYLQSLMACKSKHYRVSNPVMSKYEKENLTEEECMTIPIHQTGWMKQNTLETLQRVQQMFDVVPNEIETSRNKKSKMAHTGKNLGTTLVSGGGHCKNINSGSYHPGHIEVVTVKISTVVVTILGTSYTKSILVYNWSYNKQLVMLSMKHLVTISGSKI
jgi:hypothetical protein